MKRPFCGFPLSFWNFLFIVNYILSSSTKHTGPAHCCSMKLNDHADMQKLEEWLDKDLTQCAAKKYKELLMIIDGMQLAMDPQADENDIFEQFYDDLSTNWLEKVFVPRRAAKKLEIAYVDAAMTFARIFQNENGSFHKVVKNIIKLIKLNQKKSDIRH